MLKQPRQVITGQSSAEMKLQPQELDCKASAMDERAMRIFFEGNLCFAAQIYIGWYKVVLLIVLGVSSQQQLC